MWFKRYGFWFSPIHYNGWIVVGLYALALIYTFSYYADERALGYYGKTLLGVLLYTAAFYILAKNKSQ